MKTILWVLVALVAGLYITGPIQDPDLWWHITVGRWILAHGAVPHEDLWSMFSHGEPWRAYSWSTEILFALADRWGAEHGLLALKLLFAVALSLSLAGACSLLARDWFVGLLLGIFAAAGCYNHFTLRPQSLVWIWFALLIVVADQIERHGFSRRRRIGVIVLMALWANTHLTALLGIITAMGWSFGRASQPPYVAIRRAAEVGALAFLGTLVTPYLGGEWMTFISKTGHPVEFHIVSEFQPATVMQYPTSFLALAGMLLWFLSSGHTSSISLARSFLWVGFTLAGLAVVKFMPFAIILSVAMIARAFRDQQQRADQSSATVRNALEGVERLRRVIEQTPREGLAFVFVCLAIVNVYRVWKVPVAYEVVPKQAVDFIEEQRLPLPIANIFGHGGYLIYRFSDASGEPMHRVAIDGRTNMISKEYWHKYLGAALAKRHWREYFEQIDPGTILWRDDSPLGTVLLAENRWCVVHESGPERARVSVWVKREYFESRREDLHSENCR